VASLLSLVKGSLAIKVLGLSDLERSWELAYNKRRHGVVKRIPMEAATLAMFRSRHQRLTVSRGMQ